jgi:hypothetical protein
MITQTQQKLFNTSTSLMSKWLEDMHVYQDFRFLDNFLARWKALLHSTNTLFLEEVKKNPEEFSVELEDLIDILIVCYVSFQQILDEYYDKVVINLGVARNINIITQYYKNTDLYGEEDLKIQCQYLITTNATLAHKFKFAFPAAIV